MFPDNYIRCNLSARLLLLAEMLDMICISIFDDPLSNLLHLLHPGVGAGGEEQKSSSISVFHLPWLAFVVALMFVGILPYSASDWY